VGSGKQTGDLSGFGGCAWDRAIVLVLSSKRSEMSNRGTRNFCESEWNMKFEFHIT
jgi:hypothetical protein